MEAVNHLALFKGRDEMSQTMIHYTTINIQDYQLTLYKTKHGLTLIETDIDRANHFADYWLKKRFNHFQLIQNDQLFVAETEQLVKYFAGELKTFDFAIDQKGTDFQKTVWCYLQDIPYGETLSYSELARRMNRPTATRAVSRAIGQNPLLIVVPCHRVIGKSNKLTGFRSGLALKQALLNIEKSDHEKS